MPLANSISLSSPAALAAAGGAALSDDTSLSVFTLDDIALADEGDADFPYDDFWATSLSGHNLVTTATHPGATVGTITLTPDPFIVGDNSLDFDVTAEDGVTVQHYNVTLHVLTAGVAEETTVTFGLGASFVQAGPGFALVISTAAERLGLWGNTGTETQPDLSGLGVTRYVEVALTALDTTEEVAGKYATVLVSEGFSINQAVATLEITNASSGPRTDAADNTSGATINVSVTTQGEDPS